MKKLQPPLLLLALLGASVAAGGAGTDPAPQAAAGDRSGHASIEASIRAMGGLDLLRSLGVVHTEGVEVVNEMSGHDRPGMTLYTRIYQFQEWRDAKNRRRRYEATRIGVPAPSKIGIIMDQDVAVRTFDGDPLSDFTQLVYGIPARQQSDEALALAPEQALLAALDAPDLKVLPATEVDGVPLESLELHRQNARIRLFLNRDNHLPTDVEITRELPDDPMFGELGELTTRIHFTSWWLVAGKLRYPREWNVYFRDRLQRQVLIDKLELNAATTAETFAVPEATAAAFRNRTAKTIEDYPLGSPESPQPQEIAPGVVFIPGFMNVVLVRQDDGIVVIEAPISCGYSARVIEESGRRFPGAPITAVISTSDAPVHFGGVREYAARRIPIYVRDSNLASLQALLAAPHKVLLDAYARAPQPPDFRVVGSKITVGSGANRLEIYPARSGGGERSLLVYLPQHRLLYAADLPLRNSSPSFQPFTVIESVAQEHLEVDRVLGVHPGPTPWKDVAGVSPK